MEISTSLLSVKEENSLETFYKIEASHTDYFHIDVMDGEFVKNNTIELMQNYIDNLKGITNTPIEVHLMVKDIKKYVDIFLASMPRTISFHIEVSKENLLNNTKGLKENKTNTECLEENKIFAENSNENKILPENLNDNTLEFIKYIKDAGCKVGIAINPETDIEEIYKYLPYIHTVMIMTVHPGEGGQQLIPETILKIKKLKKYLKQNNLENEIEVDGGVNLENIRELHEAGADIAVVGSFMINSKDYKYTMEKLKQA